MNSRNRGILSTPVSLCTQLWNIIWLCVKGRFSRRIISRCTVLVRMRFHCDPRKKANPKASESRKLVWSVQSNEAFCCLVVGVVRCGWLSVGWMVAAAASSVVLCLHDTGRLLDDVSCFFFSFSVCV